MHTLLTWLGTKDLDNILVDAPAAILDKVDVIRRKRQQAMKLADDFLEIFGDPVTNPKGIYKRQPSLSCQT